MVERKINVVPGVCFSQDHLQKARLNFLQQTTNYIPSFFSVKAEDYIAGTHEDSNYIQEKKSKLARKERESFRDLLIIPEIKLPCTNEDL